MPYAAPISLGIVLCDLVIEDRRTGKKSYIGVFNDIIARRLPAKHPCMFLAVTLTNCLGNQRIEVNISHDTDYGDEPILKIAGDIQARNPLDIIEMVFELRDIPVRSFGKHTIEVTAMPEGERIAQRSFFVKEIPGA